MARLGRWCFEHRKRVVAIWLLAIVVVAGVSVAVGSSFNSNLSLPGTDSQAAAALLTQNFPAASGEGDQVVIQATHGATIQSAPVRSAVTAALAKVAKVPGVESVASPYAKNGAAQISRDGTIAFARVTWDKPSAQVATADAGNLIGAAESADGPDVHISVGGQSIETQNVPVSGYPSWWLSPRRWSSC
jgi:putative drug exporter of the RND superfamily